MKRLLMVAILVLPIANSVYGQEMPATGQMPATGMNGEVPAAGTTGQTPVLGTPALGAPAQVGAPAANTQYTVAAQNQGTGGICNVGGVDLQNIFHGCKVTGIEYQGMFALLRCKDTYGNPVSRDVKIGDHLAFYMFAMGKGYEMNCVTVGPDNHLMTGRVVSPDANPDGGN